MKQTIVSLVLAGACLVLGQTPATDLKFEVASVKRSEGGGPPGDIPRNMDPAPGHFAMRNAPLRHYLVWAYDLADIYEISGPDWIAGMERYDIVARAAGAANEDQMKLMLRTLLMERFQMKLHREKKDLPVYVMLPGKGAAKVKPAAGDGDPSIRWAPDGTTFHKYPISRLTFMLTRRMDRPVLDQTGLNALYDYTVDLSGLSDRLAQSDDASGLSVFTAVQRDLGLRMEAKKEPVDVLVIDSANKVPVEN